MSLEFGHEGSERLAVPSLTSESVEGGRNFPFGGAQVLPISRQGGGRRIGSCSGVDCGRTKRSV